MSRVATRAEAGRTIHENAQSAHNHMVAKFKESAEHFTIPARMAIVIAVNFCQLAVLWFDLETRN